MTSKTPIIYTPKEMQRHYIIMAQQKLNTAEWEYLDQDSLEDID